MTLMDICGSVYMKTIKHVGFTGTRKGMSWLQEIRLVEIPSGLKTENCDIYFHHGSCIGADCQADNIARNFECKMYIHPSNDSKTRIHCVELGDTVYSPKPHLVRDRDIVNAVSLLIGAPKGDKEELRSGTWTTVRYARKRGIDIIMLKR